MIAYCYRDEELTYEELFELERDCFPDADLTRKQYDDRRSYPFWTAREDGVLAGYAYSGPRGEGTHLFHLGVMSKFRRKGVASELIRQCASQARDIGSPFLTLCVLAGNAPARALYEKMGFREFGEPLRRYSIDPGDIPEAKPLATTREGEGYKYALRFWADGADVGGGQYNEEIGGLKDFTLSYPERDLPGAFRFLAGLLKPEQDLVYVMTDDAPTIAACEKSPLTLWSAICNMKLGL